MKLYSVSNVAAILIETCGEQAALAVVDQFGGQRLDVPKKLGGKLVQALGAEVASVLVDHYAGCRIDVPSKGHVERIHRTIQLRNDVLHSGLSSNELAARHGVTSSWVRKLRVQLGVDPAPVTQSPKV